MKEDEQKNTKEEKKAKKSNEILDFLKLYVAPLLALVLFIAIIIFLIIPKITTILDKLDENSLLNTELDNKKADLESLKAMETNRTTLSSDLEIINDIAPTGNTEVVLFGNKITDLATKHSLNVSSQEIGETPTQVTTQTDNSTDILILKEVPLRFELSGSYEDILDFLNELDELDDFIVFKEFQFSEQFTDLDIDLWTLNLTIAKYQFAEPETETPTSTRFQQVPLSAKISDIMREYIDARK